MLNDDDRKWLYGKMVNAGVDAGSFEDFTRSMERDDDRDWYYRKSVDMGLDVGSVDDFTRMMRPEAKPDAKVAAPWNGGAQVNAGGADGAVGGSQVNAGGADKAVGADKAGGADKAVGASVVAAPWNGGADGGADMAGGADGDAMVKDDGAATDGGGGAATDGKVAAGGGLRPTWQEKMGMRMRLDGLKNDVRMQQDAVYRRMEDMRRGGGLGAFAGELRQNPVSGMLERRYVTRGGDVVGSKLEQSAENMRIRDVWEAGTEEGRRHRERRMEGDFVSRVGESVSRHDPDNVAEQAWKLAEERTAADRDSSNKRIWDGFAALGGGREMRMMAAGEARHSNMVDYLTNHDLQRMADDAWNLLGEEKQQAIVGDVYGALRDRYPGADEGSLQEAASAMAREQSDRRVYELAVEKNAPQDATEYFFRKAMGMNSVMKIHEALARSAAGTTGDWEAREVAEQEFGRGHKLAGVAGTVTGFVFEPLTVLSAGLGGAAAKGSMWLGGKLMGAAAARRFATSLGGRMAAGAVGGAFNLGAFEAGSEVVDQLKWGGHRDAVTGKTGDYSMGAVAGSFGHGFVMGAATGVVAPMIGNVSDRMVRATESTVGKVALRAGELGVSTVAEGTIFSVPEWIEGGRDAMDVWTDNMAMMAGFKVHHAVKSARRVIGELASKGNGRAGFETRLRSVMDGRDDLALTGDEREELDRLGYGDLNGLAGEYGRYREAKDEYDNARTTTTDPGRMIGSEGGEAELPYNRFIELMDDNRVSEAARAKMYYYITGRTLPMSTVMGSSVIEKKDADGNVGGYIVQSYGANGIITSRTFGSKKRAGVEVNRINRQAELNGVDVGERYVDWQGDNRRMYEACRSVAEETGAPVNLLLELMRNKTEAMNDVELEWSKKINEAYEGLGDKYSSAEVRRAIVEEFGVDVDNAIRKEPGSRNEQERKAIGEYGRRLFADVKRKQEEAAQRGETPNDHTSTDTQPPTSEQVSGLLGIDNGEPGDGMSATFRRGYDADVQERRDIAIGLSLVDQDSADYAEAQEAWNGVVRRIEDEADYMAAQERERGRMMRHADGSLRPATLKEKDVNGHDRLVYVVEGNVVMTPDGTMVDVERSDRNVCIYDPEDGRRKMIATAAGDGILSLGEVTGAEDYEAGIEQNRQRFIQEQTDRALGKVAVVPGKGIVLPDGEEAAVVAVDAGGEGVVVRKADGTQTSVQLDELQRVADEAALADYRARHGIDEEQGGDTVERPATGQGQVGVVEGAPADYADGVELTVRDEDGAERTAMVMGRVRYVDGEFVPDANGNIVEYLMDGDVWHEHIDKLKDKVVGHVPAKVDAEVEDNGTKEDVLQHAKTEVYNDRIDNIEPTGKSILGNLFTQFRGKASDAIGFLLRRGEGNAVAALHHKDVGDIDLWYGNDKAGLKKIAAKHPEVLDDLQGIIDNMHVVQASENRIILESDTHKAVVSKMLGNEKTDNWLLSAYEKKGISASSSDIETEPVGKQNGTAPLQDSLSIGKVGENMGDVQGNAQENAQVVPMPMTGSGDDAEPDFMGTTPQRGRRYIYDEAGLSREESDQFVTNNIEAASKLLDKVRGKVPKMGTSLSRYNRDKAAWQQQVADAQRVLDYWRAVKNEQDVLVMREREEQRAREAAAHEAAVQQAQADFVARKTAEEERRVVGNGNPIPAITERWGNAVKVDGDRDELVLPDGERIKGHYVLHESGAASASHNPQTWEKTDGFPMDASDNSVNDRDYERDTDAQQVTLDMARRYDQRALQSPVVVSSDGVVLSGNGRTMAGELAARLGTDGAYIGYLREYAHKYGFTPEQVGAMQHPRVSFVPDVRMPYTAETFARFNQQEMKSQNKTEQAVKLGKTVDDDTFRRIVRSINGFDTLGEFYADAKASLGAVYGLRDAGVIPQAQMAEMVDGAKGKERLSAIGREMLENVLVGKAFAGYPEMVRMLTAVPSMRQSGFAALGEISDNIALGNGFALQDELAEAVSLVYNARTDGGYQHGDLVSLYARQGVLFADPDQLSTVADFNNAAMLMLADVLNDRRVSLLKTVVALYNSGARGSAAGMQDLFDGGVRSREDILKDVINFINSNYGRNKEIEAARAAAVERRKAEGVQQVGAIEDGSGDGSAEDAEAGGGGNVGRGGNGGIAGREQGDLEKGEGIDENGIPFVKAADGTDVFGVIREDSGLQPAPIRLSEGFHDADGKGYGRAHIEANHGRQIRNAGFASVEDFVAFVSKNYDEDNIRVGKRRENGSTTYLLQVQDKHDNTLFIEMSHDGSYWNVNSGGIFRKGYSNKKETVAKTEPQQPKNAVSDGSSLSADGYSGITSAEPNGEPTVPGGKVGENTGDVQVDAGKVEDYVQPNEVQAAVLEAEADVNVSPTEAQKTAGNYRKGHLRLDGFDVSIEQPKGSVRRGTDADGKQWEQVMHNTYGYIRGTEGVDGDHIDVFLGDDPSQGDVFVVDQVNKDGTFDEHKVMYGFADEESARQAYLANYEDGWQGLGAITRVSKDEFRKWVMSSHRKTKPFSEYKGVKTKAGGGSVVGGQKGDVELLDAVNERFNEELSGLTEENKDKVVLSLGRPSDVLLAAGVVDRPMKLYGNKVIKKMRKHGFALDELRNLPSAVADPIAVFDNIGREGNRSILTELKTNQGNFLVTVDLGKDADIDFNIVSSVFGKGDNNIVGWINKGLATYINKEKARLFLSHQSAPIAAAAANKELVSAAKVVESFENPKVVEEKSSDYGYKSSKDGKSQGYKTEGGEMVKWRSLFTEEEMQGIASDEKAGDTFKPTDIRLRPLQEGEQCNVERRYVENGMFDFTGKEKIESEADVAYIFRELENAAVENSFLVLVKDGRPTVIHLGMGSYTSTMAPFEQAFVAYSELKPDEVYFVHNHPSGKLKASSQDQNTLDRLKKMFGRDVVNPGIIIDTTSGKYGLFDGINIDEDMPVGHDGNVPIKVYSFGRQVFAPGWNPREAFKIRSSEDVASFVSSHRLGGHGKMSFLVLGNDGSVVANVFLPYTKLTEIDERDGLKEACDMMAGYVHQCGGVRGIIYGNYEYSDSEEVLLNRISLRMNQLGTPLLDVIHIEHSARDEGVVSEPGTTDVSLEAVNGRFNEELGRLNEGNAQDIILNIGNPGEILRSAGVSDMPIRLYGNKLLKKMRKHGFVASDVKDLPLAINNPIAVFNNYGNEKNRAVLTELKTSQGNVLATIEWGKGTDAEINIVTSVFGKGKSNIVYWINKGLATYINKEKALEYLRISAPIAEAQDRQELVSATKVVEGFENPSVGGVFFGEDSAVYRLREDAAPKRTGVGYKVFVLKDGKLYPPMVANPGGEATPVGVWLDADAAPVAGVTRTGRQQVKAGGKGTQGGSGKLAYRPGWHLGEIPYALQFNRLDPETGQRELFPANFVWAEVEYADDVDYQEEAMSYGMNGSGKFQHSLAGLPKVPVDGSYRYRTNPDPRTDAWIITGAMKVNRILKPSEVDAMVEAAGRVPQRRQVGAVTDEQVDALNRGIVGAMQQDAVMKRRTAELMGERLNTPINIIEDVEGITHSSPVVQARRRRSKGWYDAATGQVYVVLGNNRDVDDVAATVAHETIAHKGMREMVGVERYDEFLDEVYSHLRGDLKEGVDAEAGRAFIDDATANGGNAKSYEQHRRTATDELFGRLAEKPFEEFSDGERTLWQKLKDTVRRLLDKFLGSLKLPKWFELGDNELRYMLWRSKERLERGGEHPIDLARDMVKREELGLADEARYNMGDGPDTFKARQKRAVENKGTVMLGLNGAVVNVVEVPRHDFAGTGKEALRNAEEWAKENITGIHSYVHDGVKPFDYGISNKSIEKYLSSASVKNSENMGVHISVLKKLPDVISESIETEEHADYSKGNDGKRSLVNPVNDKELIHRFYGSVSIDGNVYRVKTTLKEYSDASLGAKAYNYEVTKIELIEAPFTGVNGISNQMAMTPTNSISAAKLLKDVEKSYDKGKKLLEESTLADVDGALYRDGGDTDDFSPDGATSTSPQHNSRGRGSAFGLDDIWKDGSMGLEERTTLAKLRLSKNHKEDKVLRNDAMRAIGGNLSDLRRAMGIQRRFDMTTVKRVHDLARVLMSSGFLNNMSPYEFSRLLAAVKNSVGKNDIEASVQKVMDIMVDNQLMMGKAALNSLETIRGSKVDARGVEVQGELDPSGSIMLEAFKEGRRFSADKLEEEIARQSDRMDSNDESISEEASNAYVGLLLARQYHSDIKEREEAEHTLREELKTLKEETSEQDRQSDRYKQTVKAIEDAIRQNKIERAQAYYDLVGRLTDSMRESIANAKAFKEAEKKRVREIHHIANSDMQGREMRGHKEETLAEQLLNFSPIRFILTPLANLDQMLRMLGSKNADGKGYMWNHYMRGWSDSADREQMAKEKYNGILDEKVSEIFGERSVAMTGGIVKRKYRYMDLYGYADVLDRCVVKYYDGAEEREYPLSQAQLLYLYGVEKMQIGAATNRKMGITEEVMEQIEGLLDPRLKEFADWVQAEYLPMLGNEMNEVHKKMFGANMASIDGYFPFVRDKKAIKRTVENGEVSQPNDRISTTTGAIKKRTANVINWDIPNCNYFDVLARHVSEGCHWMSFAELNRDFSTLLSYNRLKQQVMGITSAFGSGEKLWNRFAQVCAITTDAYEPKRSEADELMVKMAKNLTLSKIAFNPMPAIKQMLSLPAFAGEVSPGFILKDLMMGGIPAVKWAWENLPNFRKRVSSRMVGEYYLRESDYDRRPGVAGALQNFQKRMERMMSKGMLPNIGVDAWTIAVGAHGVYQTAKKKYLRWGMSEEKAEKMARQDATLCYNKSQQSSEGPFMAPIQVDHTFMSTTAMMFRNSSTSYTRECYSSVRNLKRLMSGEVDVDFMAKQILRMAEIPTYSMRFDHELEQQIAGTLPQGHIYSLGMPGGVLQSAGFPDAPIEMSSTRLAEKSTQANHPFPLEAVKGLVEAMNAPIAVFRYGNNAVNVIVGLEYKGKQFLVGVHFNQHRGGSEVSSVRGLFPKDNAEWLNWISQGKARYLDHKKIKALIAQQRINLADVDYLDLKDVANVMKNFVNPEIPEQKNFSEWRDEDVERARKLAKKEIRGAYIRNFVNVNMFGWMLPWLWRIGGMAPLLLLSGDDDDKEKRIADATRRILLAPLEGLAYGDVLSDAPFVAWDKFVREDVDAKMTNIGRDNPLYSDLGMILRHMDHDVMLGCNDIANIIVSMTTGANPQMIANWAAAWMDKTSGDKELSNEWALFASRLINTPQSQLENIYFDEVGLHGDEASNLTPDELAERYARYKVKRGYFVTPWVWDDEERIGKQKDKAEDVLKERAVRSGDAAVDESYLRYEDVYKGIAERLRAARKAGKRDYVREAELLDAVYNDAGYDTYERFRELDRDYSKLVDLYLGSESDEEAALCRRALMECKRCMVGVLDARDDAGRERAYDELDAVLDGFYAEYDALRPNR